MGWIDNMREKLNPGQPSIAASHGESSPANIVDFNTAYDEIDVIHRSIEIIINGLVEVPFLIDHVNSRGPNKKVETLLNVKPNPFEDRTRFFRRAFLDYYLDGNCFFYYDKGRPESDGSLYLLPANDVNIIPDKKTFVAGYEFQPLAAEASEIFGFGRMPINVVRDDSTSAIFFEAEEIIHIKNDSSSDIYRGDSKLKNLDRIIKLYYHLISFQQQFFKNNAIPGFVLSTPNVLSTKIKTRLLEEWGQNYNSLFNNARNPAILDGGLKVDPFSSMSFKDLDFESAVERLQQDMVKGLGVPWILLKSGNNANITPNQSMFYTHTIIPILQQFASAFAHRFDVIVTADKQSVTALRPDTRSEALYYVSLVNGGIIKPNEAREGLRFDKLEDDECNHIRIPQNIAGSASDPTQGGRPASSGPSTATGPQSDSDSL